MAIVAKSENPEKKLPTTGLHKAVLADVHDLGWHETQWGDKHYILLVFEINEEHPDFGGPFRVNKRYNLSLHEKATLSKDLESWRGKGFTKEQRKQGIDLEKMIGQNAYINVVHNETESGTYDNIVAIMPLPKDQIPMEVSEDYVRIKDRKDENEEAPVEDNFAANGDEWDDNLTAKHEEPGEFDPEADDGLPF